MLDLRSDGVPSQAVPDRTSDVAGLTEAEALAVTERWYDALITCMIRVVRAGRAAGESDAEIRGAVVDEAPDVAGLLGVARVDPVIPAFAAALGTICDRLLALPPEELPNV
jgi:hypothetical protein